MLLSILLAMHLQIYPQARVQQVTEAKQTELSAVENAEPNIAKPHDWGKELNIFQHNPVVIVKGISLTESKKNAPQPAVEPKKGNLIDYAKGKVVERFGESEWQPFYEIIMRESGWNWQARNKSSGAFGLGQALPASKMGELGKSPEGQIEWVIAYISDRYDTPSSALYWHNSHNWY